MGIWLYVSTIERLLRIDAVFFSRRCWKVLLLFYPVTSGVYTCMHRNGAAPFFPWATCAGIITELCAAHFAFIPCHSICCNIHVVCHCWEDIRQDDSRRQKPTPDVSVSVCLCWAVCLVMFCMSFLYLLFLFLGHCARASGIPVLRFIQRSLCENCTSLEINFISNNTKKKVHKKERNSFHNTSSTSCAGLMLTQFCVVVFPRRRRGKWIRNGILEENGKHVFCSIAF